MKRDLFTRNNNCSAMTMVKPRESLCIKSGLEQKVHLSSEAR